MEILKFPHQMLFRKCDTVEHLSVEHLKSLLDRMWETMTANKGMGLAANQVGLNLRMFVMMGPNQEKIYLVNPVIQKQSVNSANLREGCLSAPGELIVVPSRVDWVQVKFEDEQGNLYFRIFEGIHAVCAQHEIDHLDGKAFMEDISVPKDTRRRLKKKWSIK